MNENGIHSLIILSATRQDHGQYKCVARNKAGEAVFFVTLNVMGMLIKLEHLIFKP